MAGFNLITKVGANTTLILQDPPALTVALQLFVSEKSPVTVIELTVRGPVPEFVRFTD